MVCFASSLPTPHPLTQSTLTGLSHSFTHIKSSPHIKSSLVCVCHGLLCLISAHPSSTHPIHPDRSNPFLRLHQVLILHQSLLWLALSPSSPDTLFANPPSQSLHSALALSPSSPDTLFANPPSQSLHSALAFQL